MSGFLTTPLSQQEAFACQLLTQQRPWTSQLEGSSGSRYTMKRSANTRRSPALPGYDFEYVSSLEELEKLADDFRQLEHLASREVAIAMGIAQS